MNRPLTSLALLLPLTACSGFGDLRPYAVDLARKDFRARVAIGAPPDAVSLRDLADADVAAAVAQLLEEPLSDESAVRLALLNNRDVRAGYARLGIAAADLVRAGLLRNPVLSAESLWRPDASPEIGVGLAQPFLDLFWRPLRVHSEGLELDGAIAAVTRELVQLTFGVRRELVRVRAAEQLVLAQQQSLASAAAAHALMRELNEAGNVVPAQLSAARILEGRARLELAAAERAAREAREPLNALLGLWGSDVLWRSEGPLAASATAGLELTDLEARSVAASLDLRERRAGIDAAAQDARLTGWSRWTPSASLGVGGRKDAGDDRQATGFGVRFEMPVFDNGAAGLQGDMARVEMLLHRFHQRAVEVRAVARLLRERVDLLDRRTRFLADELLPAQTQLLHHTLQNYNAMQIGAFDVLQQKQQQLAAVREQVTTLRDAWLARLDVEEVLAGSVPAAAQTRYWPDQPAPDRDDRGGH